MGDSGKSKPESKSVGRGRPVSQSDYSIKLMFRPTEREEKRLCVISCMAYKFVHDRAIESWPPSGWYHSPDCPVRLKWPRSHPPEASVEIIYDI